MRIFQTAHRHIGQPSHEYDRAYKHQQFLNWPLGTLANESIDALLISGDLFNMSNPSAASIQMFCSLLTQAVKANADLQIITTAGYHDSAIRFESPRPLLESSNIRSYALVKSSC